MKKLLLSVAVVATMGLASCGGEEEAAGESKVCACMKEKPSEMSDDCKKLKEEASKSPEAMKKMEADAEACGKDKKDDKKEH